MRSLFRALILGAVVLGCATRSHAQFPPPGQNFDGILSLIYDSSSGNVFLENAPLPNPAVQQLSIASAAGNLLSGNLALPVLSPPVTVLSATPNLIHVTWSGGNFLGTGSSLGNILAPSILEPALRADLSINYAPVSQSLTPGDLIYGTFGTTQGNPVLPNSGGGGFFRFFNVASGQFMDPPFATGFIYNIDANASLPGAAFTKVGFPIGLGNNFTVTSTQGVVSGIAENGQHVFSGGGVSSFTVTGINPPVDAANGNAFPLYMEFSTPTASFSMLAIPEPATATLVGVCAVMGLGAVRRRMR